MDEQDQTASAQQFAEEFLRLVAEGWTPDPEEYLARVPDEFREECARLMEAGWEEPAEQAEQAESADPAEPAESAEPAGLALDETATREAEVPEPEPEPEPEPPPPPPLEIPALEEPPPPVEIPVLEDPIPPAEEPHAPDGMPRILGFRIEQKLGTGTLGDVYYAWEEGHYRHVALRVLDPQKIALHRGRVVSEARRAASLEHRSIGAVHAVTENEAGTIIVSEFVEGEPLDQAVKPLGFRGRAKVFLEIARALRAAHSDGAVHGSLKPNNVIVGAKNRPKLVDFGLALSAHAHEDPEAGQSFSPYLAPEQVQSIKPTKATDIFAFGSLMYAALTGRPPFSGESGTELKEQIAKAQPPLPRVLRPKIPVDLQTICLACMARQPKDRPSAREVVEDLARYLGGEPARLQPALFRRHVARKVPDHTSTIDAWAQHGMVSPVDRDRLRRVYRRIQSDHARWRLDPRRTSLAQVDLYVGIAAAVVGTALWAWTVRDQLSTTLHWALPLWSFGSLLLLAFLARARREVVGAGAFLAGVVLVALPAAAVTLVRFDLFAGGAPGVVQLLPDTGYSNLRLLVASGDALVLSLLAWLWLRMAVFAWTSALLATSTYGAFLLTRNLLALDTGTVALLVLPLAALGVIGILCEVAGRPRWAPPFHLLALGAIVASLEVVAVGGRTWDFFDGAGGIGPERAEALAFTFNGLVFLVFSLVLERTRSLDFRCGARILQALAALHIVASLHQSYALTGTAEDLAFYLAGLVLLLLVGALGSRGWLLAGGLAGIPLVCFVLLEHGRVDPLDFAVVLTGAGVLVGILVYLHLVRRRA